MGLEDDPQITDEQINLIINSYPAKIIECQDTLNMLMNQLTLAKGHQQTRRQTQVIKLQYLEMMSKAQHEITGMFDQMAKVSLYQASMEHIQKNMSKEEILQIASTLPSGIEPSSGSAGPSSPPIAVSLTPDTMQFSHQAPPEVPDSITPLPDQEMSPTDDIGYKPNKPSRIQDDSDEQVEYVNPARLGPLSEPPPKAQKVASPIVVKNPPGFDNLRRTLSQSEIWMDSSTLTASLKIRSGSSMMPKSSMPL